MNIHVTLSGGSVGAVVDGVSSWVFILLNRVRWEEFLVWRTGSGQRCGLEGRACADLFHKSWIDALKKETQGPLWWSCMLTLWWNVEVCGLTQGGAVLRQVRLPPSRTFRSQRSWCWLLHRLLAAAAQPCLFSMRRINHRDASQTCTCRIWARKHRRETTLDNWGCSRCDRAQRATWVLDVRACVLSCWGSGGGGESWERRVFMSPASPRVSEWPPARLHLCERPCDCDRHFPNEVSMEDQSVAFSVRAAIGSFWSQDISR